MGRVRELQNKVEKLEEEINSLNNKFDALCGMMNDLRMTIDDRIDARIEGKVRVRTVENLTAYQKGKKIKPYLDEIF